MADEPTTEVTEEAEPKPVSTMPETAAAVVQRGKETAEAEAPAEASDPDQWWQAAGEEALKIREGKKWKEPEDFVKGYIAERERAQRAEQERAEFARYIEELEAMVEQGPQQTPQQQAPMPPAQGQPPELDFDSLAASCINPDTGEMDYARLMSLSVGLGARMAFEASEQRFAERLSQFDRERISPLAEQAETNRVAEELTEIERVYGTERFEEIGGRVEEAMKEDSGYMDRFGGVRGAFAEMSYRMQREEAENEARSAEGFALTSGGRRPQERRLSPEDAERELMERYIKRTNDGF